MLVLINTTDTIKAVLGGSVTTNQPRCMAAYRDITTSLYTPGRDLVNLNNTTAVTIVGAPAASTQRVVDFLSIYNHDTVAQTVTVTFDANGTGYILWKGALGPEERLEYADGVGFRVTAANGLMKMMQQATPNIVSAESVVVLASDVINNNGTANTAQDVTNLYFPMIAGETYKFSVHIGYTSAATTTGSRWMVNGPASPTFLYLVSRYTLTATTETFNYVNAYDAPAASNASSLTAGNSALLWGLIKPTSNGNLQIRFASEILSSAITAKAGSFLLWRRIA